MKWTKARLKKLVVKALHEHGFQDTEVEAIYWLGQWSDPKVVWKGEKNVKFRCAEVRLRDAQQREIVKFATIERDGAWRIN